MKTIELPVRKIGWTNLVFFLVTGSLGLVAAPLYLIRHGLSLEETLLFVFFLTATSLSITTGYHRLFAHLTYRAHPAVQFLMLFFGAAAFEQSAYKWASQHRTHHQFSDTDQDPYSIKKGFFHAHIGWLIFWRQPQRYDNVRDLERNAMVMHQHRHYKLWAVASGIVLPVLIGLAMGHALGAFLLAVCLRLTLVYQMTFCINSFCHKFGKATYDIFSTAKDHWFAALLTNGEGYHNYHHHFPADYRNGVRWYHWDPTKWLIRVMAWLGVATDLKKISPYKIIHARLRAKVHTVEARAKVHPKLEAIRAELLSNYAQLKNRLAEWENSAASSRNEAKRRFQEKLRVWNAIYARAIRLASC